jgi:thioredoxin 1
MAKKKNYYLILAFALIVMLVGPAACSQTTTSESPLGEALANGNPTLAGFVGEECGCKDMKPILKELATEYDGRCNIVVIDVAEHKDVASQYGIMLTPTEVFLDSTGSEVERFIGSCSQQEVVDQLREIGVE